MQVVGCLTLYLNFLHGIKMKISLDGCKAVQREHISCERAMVCQMRNVLPAMTSMLHHNMCASCTYLEHHQLTCNHWTRTSHSVYNECNKGRYYICYCEKENVSVGNRRSRTPCKIDILSVLPTPVARPTNYDFPFLTTVKNQPLRTVHLLCKCILW